MFWGNRRGTVTDYLPWDLYVVMPDALDDLLTRRTPSGEIHLAESAMRPLDLIESVGEL